MAWLIEGIVCSSLFCGSHIFSGVVCGERVERTWLAAEAPRRADAEKGAHIQRQRAVMKAVAEEIVRVATKSCAEVGRQGVKRLASAALEHAAAQQTTCGRICAT